MKNSISILLLLLVPFFSYSQPEENSCAAHQKKLDKQYKSRKDSPLNKKDRRHFKGFEYFDCSENFIVKASFEKFENLSAIEVKTSTSRMAKFQIYGVAKFRLDHQDCELLIYQSLPIETEGEYKDYLFLAFNDLTNGAESYGGGRYIDLKIPADDALTIDFNTSYNPYCAYSDRYSCPIPPAKNRLNVAVKSGIKYNSDNWHKH